METPLSNHFCLICHKYYSSYNSLWNHTKKYHTDKKNTENESIQKLPNSSSFVSKSYPKVILESDKIMKALTCDYCNKVFSFASGKNKHKKICKVKKEKEEKLLLIEKEIELEKLKNDNFKISYNKKSIKNINNGTINNNYNIIINFNSEENIELANKLLKKEEKITILQQPYYEMIPKLIELLYCGDYQEMKNIKIKNLKDKFALIYNDGIFESVTKEYALTKLLNNCYNNVIDISTNFKISEKKYKKFENIMEDDENVIVGDEKYKNAKTYNKDKILLLLYNDDKKNITT